MKVCQPRAFHCHAFPCLSVTSPSVPLSVSLRSGVAAGRSTGGRSELPHAHALVPLPRSHCAVLTTSRTERHAKRRLGHQCTACDLLSRLPMPCTSGVECFRYRHDPSGSTMQIPGEYCRLRSPRARLPITTVALYTLFQLDRL
jgi:hypothetical protein